MCDKDATVGNIEYIVSFFSIKKSPHDISLKNHSLIDSTVSNVQKKFTKQFFTGHIQVFFKKTIKKLYRMGFKPFSHFLFFFFAINYLYEKTCFECAVYFFVFNSEIVFLFYLLFSNSDIHDFCFHQYYNIKLGSSLISHMFIYQTKTQWAQSLFEIIDE